MFATIGHTFELMKMSWRILMKDRELVLFPLLGGVALLGLGVVFLAAAAATGTFDRVDEGGTGANALDGLLGVAAYALATFVVIFFNAALIAAALERLRGGDPTVRSGLRAAGSHLGPIIAWAAIAATVGLILQALRGRNDNVLGRIAVAIAGGVWAYMTFFVVPILVAEGIGPVQAIKRSGALFRQTWGRQAVSSFGFGLVYFGAVLIAGIPAAILFALSPVLGIAVAVPLFAIAIGTVMALEGIFKAALYEYAQGGQPLEFAPETLHAAYRAL